MLICRRNKKQMKFMLVSLCFRSQMWDYTCFTSFFFCFGLADPFSHSERIRMGFWTQFSRYYSTLNVFALYFACFTISSATVKYITLKENSFSGWKLRVFFLGSYLCLFLWFYSARRANESRPKCTRDPETEFSLFQ